MADPVNWSKLRKQAIDLVALDLPSNRAALKHVLVVLTGALIFFGCALAAVLKTRSAPMHPVPIVSKDRLTPVVPSLMPMPPSEREHALGLHEKGIEQLERGDVFAARRLFEQATEGGLAQSAVALAATFDPDELAKLKVVGLVPDVEAARKWYEKARELGAIEASERLRHLGAYNQGSTGFVAVVVTKKSRMDALKALYSLQQIYPDVLAARTPHVQEADLGEKGVWYRVVVGPPGSREAATSLCSQLKDAGHIGCWVATY
jgi:hypothetical protein